MKKWLYAAGLGVVMAASAGVQAADKIAVVDITSIFQQLPQREAVAKQLDNEFKGRRTELDSMNRDLQTKREKLQRDGQTMKASERTKLEKEAQAEYEVFGTKAQAYEQDRRRRESEERSKILTRIQDAVKVVANKGGYDFVIDLGATYYAAPGRDITADVLKQVK